MKFEHTVSQLLLMAKPGSEIHFVEWERELPPSHIVDWSDWLQTVGLEFVVDPPSIHVLFDLGEIPGTHRDRGAWSSSDGAFEGLQKKLDGGYRRTRRDADRDVSRIIPNYLDIGSSKRDYCGTSGSLALGVWWVDERPYAREPYTYCFIYLLRIQMERSCSVVERYLEWCETIRDTQNSSQ